MRMVLIALLLFLSCSQVYAYDWTQDADAVATWTFDTDASDSTASYDGTVTGATHATADPAASYSSGYYVYDGSGDKINFGDIPALDDATVLTITAWIYQDNITQDHWIFGQNDDGTNGIFFFFDDVSSVTTNTNVIRAFIAENSGEGGQSTDVESPENTGLEDVWQHVAITWTANAGAGSFVLYISGVSVDTEVTTNVVDAGQTGQDFTTGLRLSGPEDERLGRQDEIGTFSAVLDSTDINDIMDNGLVQATAVGTTLYGATIN